jgi:septal ring factor EnvC (AmiA/AmiB activator)
MDDESIARRFHDTYESAAARFGYATRPESAVPWEEVPENNRLLMQAVVQTVVRPIIDTYQAAWESHRKGLQAAAEEIESQQATIDTFTSELAATKDALYEARSLNHTTTKASLRMDLRSANEELAATREERDRFRDALLDGIEARRAEELADRLDKVEPVVEAATKMPASKIAGMVNGDVEAVRWFFDMAQALSALDASQKEEG